MTKILVVDDEPRVTSSLRSLLAAEGYEVTIAGTGEAALDKNAGENPELVILDLMLPDMDGMAVCHVIKQRRQVPVIVLTARDTVADKVLGLESGADDYLTKPFAPQELLARVKALLRRWVAASSPRGPADVFIAAGKLRVDLFSRRAAYGGKPMPLKPKELDLLVFLMSHSGQTFSQQELLEKVWGYSPEDSTRTVAVHIRGLRAKLEMFDSQAAAWIETVRGLGYRFGG